MMNTTVLTSDWRVIRKNEKLVKIVDSMQKITTQIEERVTKLNSDVMTTRNDTQIKELWNKLCVLHMKGLLYCHDNPEQDPSLINFITQPQTCIKFLHLSEEETCCHRYLSRVENNN